MRKTLVPYPLVSQLSKTDVAYVRRDALLRPFYRHEPDLQAFENVLAERARFETPRATVVEVLTKQYGNLPEEPAVRRNIDALLEDTTFTVVTAHQPALFLGPLYYIYKAVTTINLAEAVERETGRRIVPIFVLGSEDHDLEELNHARLFGKTVTWEPGETGPVGPMRSESLDHPLNELGAILGDGEAARALRWRVGMAYHRGKTFAESTQALLHEFFASYGLVVLNMSDPALKRHFLSVVREELTAQSASRLVEGTLARLAEAGFKSQAAPREINLFYLQPGSRERIVLEDGRYKVLNTELEWDRDGILAEAETHPERFSPNVVLRPLYQEMILPNLAYVGGGGEIAYWLERADLFDHFGVPFPVLMRRNSVLWVDRDSVKRLEKLGFEAARLFEDTEALVRSFVEARAAGDVDLSAEVADLQAIFHRLGRKAAAIDPTLEKAVGAEAVKFSGALAQWESRLIRAEKQRHEVSLNQLRALKEKLFPGNSLQERTDNFLPYVLKYGERFIEILKEMQDPFEEGFVVLEENPTPDPSPDGEGDSIALR
jgi:bacillithiol biosynthesis cysteine-adding enzyme BshC